MPDTWQSRKALEKLCRSGAFDLAEEQTPLGVHDNPHPPNDFHSSGTTTGIAGSESVQTGISCPGQEQTVVPPAGKEEAADITPKGSDPMEIVWNGKQLRIKMPYQEADVALIKSLSGAWWHGKARCWIVRAIPGNLEQLQKHFGYWRSDAYEKLYDLIARSVEPLTLELYTTPEYAGKCIVKVRGYRPDFAYLKRLSGRTYDKQMRRWIIPWEEQLVDRLGRHYRDLGAKIVDRLPSKMRPTPDRPDWRARQKQLIGKYPNRYHPILQEYTGALIRMRYSWNTVRFYTGAFIKFLQYLGERLPEEISASDVNEYLSMLASLKVSESSLHRAVNGIKFYYEKVIFMPDFRLDQIQRPKKGRRLPVILSINEVDRLMRSLDNVKHLAILCCIYSGGLRLSELLALRLDDIYWDRNQIMVRGGKGKKDRSVMLSETLKALLRYYFDLYQPRHYLFEGQSGGSYSKSSVQQVVRKAARKAGITRRVTPHTLRHCFATHLLDNGTDVRYIQELLGHKDIKTTLIYTHVSTQSLDAIRSPLDQLPLAQQVSKKRNDDTRM